jgi:hypothetical protein
MTQGYGTPSDRTASGRARAAVCLALLVVLVFQALPVALPSAPSMAGHKDGVMRFIEPIQVCADGSDLQGPLYEIPWLTAAVSRPSFIPGREIRLCEPEPKLQSVCTAAVFRPPRLLSS